MGGLWYTWYTMVYLICRDFLSHGGTPSDYLVLHGLFPYKPQPFKGVSMGVHQLDGFMENPIVRNFERWMMTGLLPWPWKFP